MDIMTEHWGHLLPDRPGLVPPTPALGDHYAAGPADPLMDGGDAGEVAAESDGTGASDQNEEEVSRTEHLEVSSGISTNETAVETHMTNVDTMIAERESILQLDLIYLSSKFLFG